MSARRWYLSVKLWNFTGQWPVTGTYFEAWLQVSSTFTVHHVHGNSAISGEVIFAAAYSIKQTDFKFQWMSSRNILSVGTNVSIAMNNIYEVGWRMHALKVNIFNQTRQVKNPQMMPRVLKVMHNIRLNKFFCCPTQRFCCSYNFVLKVIIIVQWAQCMSKQWTEHGQRQRV